MDEDQSRAAALAAVRQQARALLRERAHAERSLATELGRCQAEAGALAGAAVQALEVVEATARSVAPDSATREALTLALEAAWARLEAQGLVRDGALGEVPDPTRHRVLRERLTRGGSGGAGRRVSAVVEPGLLWRGRRLRPAAVVVEIGEERDGQDRD